MNLVERFFRDLSRQAILPGSFSSVRQLVDAIMEYLAQHNLNPKRYVWKAKERRFWQRSNEPGKRPLEKTKMSLLFRRHQTSCFAIHCALSRKSPICQQWM
jgi:hypothetical protein